MTSRNHRPTVWQMDTGEVHIRIGRDTSGATPHKWFTDARQTLVWVLDILNELGLKTPLANYSPFDLSDLVLEVELALSVPVSGSGVQQAMQFSRCTKHNIYYRAPGDGGGALDDIYVKKHVYEERFPDRPPSRIAVGIAPLLGNIEPNSNQLVVTRQTSGQGMVISVGMEDVDAASTGQFFKDPRGRAGPGRRRIPPRSHFHFPEWKQVLDCFEALRDEVAALIPMDDYSPASVGELNRTMNPEFRRLVTGSETLQILRLFKDTKNKWVYVACGGEDEALAKAYVNKPGLSEDPPPFIALGISVSPPMDCF